MPKNSMAMTNFYRNPHPVLLLRHSSMLRNRKKKRKMYAKPSLDLSRNFTQKLSDKVVGREEGINHTETVYAYKDTL